MDSRLVSVSVCAFLLSVCTSKKAPVQAPEIHESAQVPSDFLMIEEDDFDIGSNEVVISESQVIGLGGELPTRPITVDQKENLPACLEQDENLEIFVEMSEKVFKCNGGRWYQKPSSYGDAI